MSVFRRNRQVSVLPPGIAEQLESYGLHWLDPHNTSNDAAVVALSRLQIDERVVADPAGAANELCEHAVSAGGWALLGAWTAIHAFIPSQVDSERYCATQDASLHFLHDQDLPPQRLRRLRLDLRNRYAELFPGEL